MVTPGSPRGIDVKIGIVDYEAGNLKSVETALRYLHADYFISSDPSVLKKGDKIIFPGVGEARSAMRILSERGLDQFIKDFFKSGKPLLGICLGCQIVLKSSEENSTYCLGLVPGVSREFSVEMGLKIPHMGWNQVSIKGSHYIFRDIPDNGSFYFVHSFYPELDKSSQVIGSTEYGIEFSSAFSVDNLVALQFHPEKSGPFGLKILDNFIKGAD